MENSSWVTDEELVAEFHGELDRLKAESNAKATFLIDKSGQLIAASKEGENFDTTSLAALVAGNVAATGGLAKLLGEKEFSILFHEGENEHINISLVSGILILVVLFDENTSLGLVRLRMKKSVKNLDTIINEVKDSLSGINAESIFRDITDEDIDNLFKIGG